MAAAAASSFVNLRLPSTYQEADPSHSTWTSHGTPFIAPPPLWLRAPTPWRVVHSTLSMWRNVENVRISYHEHPTVRNQPDYNQDLVEYEKKPGSVKTIRGVNTPAPGLRAAWDWQGRGMLKLIKTHWEVLGWGERPCGGDDDDAVEKWAVTWFAKTWVSQEGIDIYTDRDEGLSQDTYHLIMEALNQVPHDNVQRLVKDMREVKVRLT
jgi:hypothetical protein